MSDSPQEGNFVDRILAKLAASRFLTISVLLHLCLVIGSGSFVLYKAVEEQLAMGVPGDMEFLSEGASQVEAPPAPDSAPQPELEQVADTMPAVSEVTTPTVSTTNISSALDSAITTTATTAAFQIASNPSATTASSISQNLATNASTVSNAIKRAGKVAPLAGAVSNVSFFGIKKKGRRIAFLLDASGSMILTSRGGKEGYDYLKAQLIEMIEKLDPTTEFNVWIFDNKVDQFKTGAVPATGDIKSEFARWIAPYMEKSHGVIHEGNFDTDRMAGFHGTTRMDLALAGAFEMGADIIFVLSDGTPQVRRPPDEKELADWEKIRAKNKEEIAAFQAESKAYHEKYKDLIAEMRQEAQRRNASLTGRTVEHTHWIEGYKGLPPRPGPAPPGTYRPSFRFDQEEIEDLLDSLVTELYIPAGIERPSINIVGYEVSDADRDWLKKMARAFRGSYEDFKAPRRR